MRPRVSAVLLAAGSARRMGRLKQLLPVGSGSAISLCVDAIAGSGIRDITVVIGPHHEEIRRALNGSPARIVVNDRPGSDMAGSVRAGISGVGACSTGVLVCLSDHPLTSAGTIRLLKGAHAAMPDKIIVPLYKGRRGHPVLFPKGVLREIFSCRSMREIIGRDAGRISHIVVHDEGTVLDMDTMDDYNEILRKVKARDGGE